MYCPLCNDLIFTSDYWRCCLVNDKLLCEYCSDMYRNRHTYIMHLARKKDLITDVVKEVEYGTLEKPTLGY